MTGLLVVMVVAFVVIAGATVGGESVPEPPPAEVATPEGFAVAKGHRLLANLDASQIAIEMRGTLAV